MYRVSVEGKIANTTEELIEILKKYPETIPRLEILNSGVSKDEKGKTIIFTDGSYKKGASSAGWAFLVVRNDNEIFRDSGSISDNKVTNNIAELTAIMKAFEYCDAKHLTEVEVYTDSAYSIGCIKQWYDGWERNGWKKADGGEISNLQMIKDIHAYYKNGGHDLKHIKAHKGHKWNELVDKLAKSKSV